MTTIDIRKAAIRLTHQTLDTGGGSASIVCGVPSPTNGYMVALPGHERSVDFPAGLAPRSKRARIQSEVEKYATLHRAVLAQPGNFVGTWVDGERLVLDVSRNLFEFAAAVEMGWSTGQDAIYDLEHGRDIVTKPGRRTTTNADQEQADLIARTNNLDRVWREARGLPAAEYVHIDGNGNQTTRH